MKNTSFHLAPDGALMWTQTESPLIAIRPAARLDKKDVIGKASGDKERNYVNISIPADDPAQPFYAICPHRVTAAIEHSLSEHRLTGEERRLLLQVLKMQPGRVAGIENRWREIAGKGEK